jgi:hypothetical protein
MKSRDHEECTDHQSVMRGVCYCPDDDCIYMNPRLWAEGTTELRPASEMDFIAGDAIEILLERFFPDFDDTYVQSVGLDICMPGMVCECEKAGGMPGVEFYQRMQ